jgi:hypothetical protein
MNSINYKRKIKWKLIILLILIVPTMGIISSNDVYSQTSLLIEPTQIVKREKFGNFVEVPIRLTNDGTTSLSLNFDVKGSVRGVSSLDKTSMLIDPGTQNIVLLTLFGENISEYRGDFSISGNIEEDIPINFTVLERISVPVEALLIEIEPITERALVGGIFKYKIGLQNLLTDQSYNVTISSSIDRLEGESTYIFDKSFFTETDVAELATSVSIIKEFDMPDFIRRGDYVINVKAEYLGLSSSASKRFRVVEPIMDMVILGILPLRWVLFTGILLLFGLIGFVYYKKKRARKKRYVAKVDFNLLPKPGPRAAFIGKIAESNKKAYFDIDQLMMHTLVAGSTGGGKTVSAEVMVEEALLKGAAVIVFDPTAQWTGYLRKNTNKKMFALYSKFGMKKSLAKAFNGNIKQILNARENIDIKKYIKPGEINVFSVSRLDPEDIDVLVANTVRQVFKANLPESPTLKLMVIFDEVHRLLPKFGGTGEGFIQIERAAREFRKWGVGLVLISQVLSDFVGETKANINTEIQMRTRDQRDLDRIQSKYGGYMLQSLLKSATGTGMLENASYNKGNPYFVAFRPLMHEHARLSDKELDNYNKYNETVDDLDFQLEQLEKEGIDVFDLKLELKMALDKVKSGSFNMVNIYLDGLKPRIKSSWGKLGKTPMSRKSNLVSESELREELGRAKEARKKFEEEEKIKKKSGATSETGVLKLDNGIMVTKRTELLDALESMDDETFKKHVTETKNDLSDWLEGKDKSLAEKIKGVKTKKEMLDIMVKDDEEKNQ